MSETSFQCYCLVHHDVHSRAADLVQCKFNECLTFLYIDAVHGRWLVKQKVELYLDPRMPFGMPVDWRDSGRSCIRALHLPVSPLQGELRFFKCRFLFSANGMGVAWPSRIETWYAPFFLQKMNFVDMLDIDNCSHPVPTVVQAITHPTFM